LLIKKVKIEIKKIRSRIYKRFWYSV